MNQTQATGRKAKMDYNQEALKVHEQYKGKLRVECPAPLDTRDDLSVAYTPGVAEPCR